LDITAQPQERHPSAAKCTMPSPHAHRHLRHVTGLAALREHELQEESAAAGGGQQQAAAAPGTADSPPFAGRPSGGRVRVLVEARGIASGEVPPPGQPTPPGGKVPSLDITVEGRDLHAPLIERLVELPMDINAGRVSRCGCFGTEPTVWIGSCMGTYLVAGVEEWDMAYLCPGKCSDHLPARCCLQANGELRIYSHDADSWHFPEFYGRVNVR
jgi:hypothetical protein